MVSATSSVQLVRAPGADEPRAQRGLGPDRHTAARCFRALHQRRPARRMAVAAALPGVGGQPERLPVPREVHRARAARRQDAAVRRVSRTRSSAATSRSRTSATRTAPTSPGSTGWRSCRSQAPTATSPRRCCTCSASPRTTRPSTTTARSTSRAGRPRRGSPAPRYSPWHRVDLSIPVRKVSPFVHEGRLYLFWIENATRPINAFVGGSSKFAGYRHNVRVRYSTLRLDGRWAAPQLIRFEEAGGVADARIVEDPLDLTVVQRLEAQIARLTNVRRPPLAQEVGAKTDSAEPGAERHPAARGCPPRGGGRPLRAAHVRPGPGDRRAHRDRRHRRRRRGGSSRRVAKAIYQNAAEPGERCSRAPARMSRTSWRTP